MDTINKIVLPNGVAVEIEDTYARQLLAGGLQFIICWDGTTAPDVTKIPAGVVVTYNDTTYTGIMATSAAEPLAFYLVYSATQEDDTDHYDEYAVIRKGAGTELDPYVYAWEKIGDTQLDLSDLGALAYKDNVALTKGDGDFVLGEDTTFTAAASEVSFAGRLTDKVLGKDTSFTVTQPSVSVTPSTKRIKATASGAAVGADGTEDCISDIGNPTTQNVVKTLSVEKTKKLVKTTVPNVTNVGAASNWAFQMGTGADAKTLIISGGNGTAPTLGTAIGVATGEVDAQGTGDAVVTDVAAGSTADAVTGLGTITKKTVLKGVKVTAQPTVTLADNAGAGEGVEVVSGIQSATASGAAVAANNDDEVDAVTNVGTGTAAAQTISVGTNDKVKVAKHGDLGVVVS